MTRPTENIRSRVRCIRAGRLAQGPERAHEPGSFEALKDFERRPPDHSPHLHEAPVGADKLETVSAEEARSWLPEEGPVPAIERRSDWPREWSGAHAAHTA